MTIRPLNMVFQQLMADCGPDEGGLTDVELLDRFLSSRDDNAVAALVQRHASMVWGVCRRLLHNHHDAEDAFQATFLVLVRKAADVPRQAAANWLYGVARQTAVRLRATAAKRGRRETQAVNMPEPTADERRDADWQPVLDEELSRLPDHYRGVIVLCDLEGLSRKEAARQLCIPEGTVASRLARARTMLAKRLTRRGVVLAGAAMAASSAPSALVASTINAASLLAAGRAAGFSAAVAALTEGVIKAMVVTRIRNMLAVVLVVVLALGGIGAGVGFLRSSAAVAQAGPPKQAPAKEEGPTSPVAAKQEDDRGHDLNRGDNALDGLWEDVENRGGWLRFQGSAIRWHPAPSQLAGPGRKEDGPKPVIKEWTCRYNLTLTPMTIDIFHKDGTDHGIFVLERGTLFIAVAETGKERPTRFKRDAGTTLFVLRRAIVGEGRADLVPPKTTEEPFVDVPQLEMPEGNGAIVVHGVLESVDARNATVTVKGVCGNDAASVLRLLAFASGKKAAKGSAAEAMLREFDPAKYPRLVNIPVRAEAVRVRSSGVGMVKEKLQVKNLAAGQVVSLQLAADRGTGFVVVGLRVLDER